MQQGEDVFTSSLTLTSPQERGQYRRCVPLDGAPIGSSHDFQEVSGRTLGEKAGDEGKRQHLNSEQKVFGFLRVREL
jgi:hypothetical protein